MHKLYQFRLDAASRAVRLALGELQLHVELVDELPWGWRPEFLAVNPSGEIPVLAVDQGPEVCGLYACFEYLADHAAAPGRAAAGATRLLPVRRDERAEARRLIDWFAWKLEREVTAPLIDIRVRARLEPQEAPKVSAEELRAIRQNTRYHLSYAAYLLESRSWLAGADLTLADLIAGAQVSILDYLDEIAWVEHPAIKTWYRRLKSRPSFAPLLADRVAGVPFSRSYADLEF